MEGSRFVGALCRSPYLVSDALFVLLPLFMIFSDRVALARYSRRKKSIERNAGPSNALDTGMGRGVTDEETSALRH